MLDIAGGTGDLSLAFAKRVGPEGQVWLTDINSSMLTVGRDRLLDKGVILPVAQCDAGKAAVPERIFRLRHGCIRPAQHDDPQGCGAGRCCAC